MSPLADLSKAVVVRQDRDDIANWEVRFPDGTTIGVEAPDEEAARAAAGTYLEALEAPPPEPPPDALKSRLDALTAKLVEKGAISQKDADDIAVAVGEIAVPLGP